MTTQTDDNWTNLTILPTLESKQAQYGGLRCRSCLLPEPQDTATGSLAGMLGVAAVWLVALVGGCAIVYLVGSCAVGLVRLVAGA